MKTRIDKTIEKIAKQQTRAFRLLLVKRAIKRLSLSKRIKIKFNKKQTLKDQYRLTNKIIGAFHKANKL